jgi:hypothetical protein
MMRSGSDADGSYVSLGDAIGVLRSEPDQLERGLGLKFRDAHDDLDALRIARIRIADGRTFALVRHRHAPEPGTQIVMTTPSTDFWGDITAVLRRLQLELNDLSWRHPAAKPRQNARTLPGSSMRSVRHSRAMKAGPSRSQSETRRATRRSAVSARAATRKK